MCGSCNGEAGQIARPRKLQTYGRVAVMATVAQVVMSALPFGLPRARAQTVHEVETSAGSWKSAPFVSVAFASSTWKLSVGGAGTRKILLTLLILLKSVPLRLPADCP